MKYITRWIRHVALNIGFALGTIVLYWWMPPQWHHTQEECAGFDDKNAWQWFLDGIGWQWIRSLFTQEAP